MAALGAAASAWARGAEQAVALFDPPSGRARLPCETTPPGARSALLLDVRRADGGAWHVDVCGRLAIGHWRVGAWRRSRSGLSLLHIRSPPPDPAAPADPPRAMAQLGLMPMLLLIGRAPGAEAAHGLRMLTALVQIGLGLPSDGEMLSWHQRTFLAPGGIDVNGEARGLFVLRLIYGRLSPAQRTVLDLGVARFARLRLEMLPQSAAERTAILESAHGALVGPTPAPVADWLTASRALAAARAGAWGGLVAADLAPRLNLLAGRDADVRRMLGQQRAISHGPAIYFLHDDAHLAYAAAFRLGGELTLEQRPGAADALGLDGPSIQAAYAAAQPVRAPFAAKFQPVVGGAGLDAALTSAPPCIAAAIEALKRERHLKHYDRFALMGYLVRTGVPFGAAAEWLVRHFEGGLRGDLKSDLKTWSANVAADRFRGMGCEGIVHSSETRHVRCPFTSAGVSTLAIELAHLPQARCQKACGLVGPVASGWSPARAGAARRAGKEHLELEAGAAKRPGDGAEPPAKRATAALSE